MQRDAERRGDLHGFSPSTNDLGNNMTSDHASSAFEAMRELADGVDFWRSRGWPADLNYSESQKWAQQNPNGNFTPIWWLDFQLRRLRKWIATRPISDEVLTNRFRDRITLLNTDHGAMSC